jgi:hypothetical protein
MIDCRDLLKYVIIPACDALDMSSRGAWALLLGTALVESAGSHLHQVKGPALGLWQMEPATHDDIVDNYLKYRSKLRQLIRRMRVNRWDAGGDEMTYNLRYAAAMARLHYRRVPKRLPVYYDYSTQGRYWKEYYNTNQGKGDPSKYVKWADRGEITLLIHEIRPSSTFRPKSSV